MVSQPDKMTLSGMRLTLVEIALSRPREYPTSGYLVLIPLCREYTSTLQIKVGTVGCTTPVGEPTTRVVIDVSVADEVRLAV